MKENMGMNANTYSINYQPKIMNVNCDSIFVEIWWIQSFICNYSNLIQIIRMIFNEYHQWLS